MSLLNDDVVCQSIIGLSPTQVRSLAYSYPTLQSKSSPVTRVLLTLLWLRQSLTERLLSWIFGISQPSVSRLKWKVLNTLYNSAQTHFRDAFPTYEQRHNSSVPFYGKKVVLIIDGTEQKIVEHTDSNYAKQTRSGKKSYHTVTKQPPGIDSSMWCSCSAKSSTA